MSRIVQERTVKVFTVELTEDQLMQTIGCLAAAGTLYKPSDPRYQITLDLAVLLLAASMRDGKDVADDKRVSVSE